VGKGFFCSANYASAPKVLFAESPIALNTSSVPVLSYYAKLTKIKKSIRKGEGSIVSLLIRAISSIADPPVLFLFLNPDPGSESTSGSASQRYGSEDPDP
jgi:hypothetical protein